MEEEEEGLRREEEPVEEEERTPKLRVIARFWGILGLLRHPPDSHTRLKVRLSMVEVWGKELTRGKYKNNGWTQGHVSPLSLTADDAR